MATALLAAVPPLPQVAGCHHEEPRCRVQVPGITARGCLLMGAHDERVVSPAGVEAPWRWHRQPQSGRSCPVAFSGSVEDEQPRSEAVFAPASRRNQALVGTATNAVGQPLGEGVGIGLSPATVGLKPCVCVPDRPSSVEVHRHSMATSRAQIEPGREDRAARGSPSPQPQRSRARADRRILSGRHVSREVNRSRSAPAIEASPSRRAGAPPQQTRSSPAVCLVATAPPRTLRF
jgi:hypothetical protein